MRLDRELTLRLFRPLRGSNGGNAVLPVLMYHSISVDSEPGTHPYYRLATSPTRFAEHLRWLHELGFTGVSLEEALEMTPARRRSCRPAAITFDDGFRDFYMAAWPILRKHGFTATMYLPTSFVDSPRKTFRERECLTWEEVHALRKAGIRFGSHTVSHPKLYELPWEEIAKETAESKLRLESELNEEVGSFAYPYAFPQEDAAFSVRLTRLLRRQGYTTCVTTIIGRNGPGSDLLQLMRLPVNNCDDHLLFRAKLNGAYDWMGAIQRLARRILRRSRKSQTITSPSSLR